MAAQVCAIAAAAPASVPPPLPPASTQQGEAGGRNGTPGPIGSISTKHHAAAIMQAGKHSEGQQKQQQQEQPGWWPLLPCAVNSSPLAVFLAANIMTGEQASLSVCHDALRCPAHTMCNTGVFTRKGTACSKDAHAYEMRCGHEHWLLYVPATFLHATARHTNAGAVNLSINTMEVTDNTARGVVGEYTKACTLHPICLFTLLR
jgi:hypothetical protein